MSIQLFHYPLSEAQIEAINAAAIEALKGVYDPEIPVNIYDLGLIYGIDITPAGSLHVRMTLTAAACPFAQTLPGIVEAAVSNIPGIIECSVELVWDPPWSQAHISEAARLQLGLV